MIQTWTYSKDGVCAIVSADNITIAKHLLSQQNISAENTDLIPCPTHHRYARVLKDK